MKKTIAFWEQIMTAITFAEANEHETARQTLQMERLTGDGKKDQPLHVLHTRSVSGKPAM